MAHPTKVHLRQAVWDRKTVEAELFVKHLRDRGWARPKDFDGMLAEFIEREHLTPRQRGRQRKGAYSFRDAHRDVTKRMIWRRVLWLEQVIRRRRRRRGEPEGPTLTEALERVAEEVRLGFETVRKYYHEGRRVF
jgi:hypothetical protein